MRREFIAGSVSIAVWMRAETRDMPLRNGKRSSLLNIDLMHSAADACGGR